MKEKLRSAAADTKLLFRSIPSVVTALFTVSVVVMNILANKTIFGVDLYEAGLADAVCAYFKELCAGKGAVRSTLHKYVDR